MSIRTERIAEQLRQEISIILRDDVTDPRIGECSITRIKLSRDLSHAQVFWSPLVLDAVDLDDMEEGLGSAAPFVRRLVAERLDLRRTPALDFRYDPSIAEGDRMLALMKEVRADDAERLADNRRDETPEGADGETDDGAAT